MIEVVNLAEKFALFADHWHPRIVGELNGQQVKLVRLKGEFIWHRHDDADELFLVVRGTLRILKDVPLGIYRSIASAKLRMKRGERASSR